MRRFRGIWLTLCLVGVGCTPVGGGSGGDGDDDARPADDGGEADAGPAVDMEPCMPDCTGRVCGDDGCGGSCGACPDDEVCGLDGLCAPPPAGCGDDTCSDDEDCATCPEDCGACCGDGQCGRGEDCASCAEDCGCADGQRCDAERGICEAEPCVGEGCGQPPLILTFNANVRRLTEGGRVVLSAVVTDPDGIADLIGGVLEDPSGASFGAFATAGEEGAYGLELGWDDLHVVTPIEFDGEVERDVVAVFFDQAGNRTSQALTLTLHCVDAGGAACAGRCVSLDSAEHCGGCGSACDDVCRDRQCVCPDGLERCDGVCVDPALDVTHCGGCGVVCPGAEGGAPVCADGRCGDPCAGPLEACDAVCVDPRADVDHCGGCGRACPGIADSMVECSGGDCAYTCDDGHRWCDDQCPACPVDGVARTVCDGPTCVAAACRDGFRLCEGDCTLCPDQDVLETACAADRCVATRCRAGTHPCAEGCCPWIIEAINDNRAFFDFLIDADGPQLAMGEDQEVRHGRYGPEGWIWTVVAEVDRAPQNEPTVGIASRDGRLAIGYSVLFPPPPGGSASGLLRVVERIDGQWQELGGPAGRRPDDPSLAFAGGDLHIVYEGDGVSYTRPDLAFRATVLDDRESGWNPHLVFHDGIGHAAWWRLGARSAGYARRDADGAWREMFPPDERTTGLAPRLAIGPGGEPAIIHRTDDDALLISRMENGVWGPSFEPVPGLLTRYGPDLVTLPNGRLMGCYGTEEGLYLLFEEGGGWRTDRVTPGDASSCRIGLGPDGAVQLVFLLDGVLIHAR